MEGSLSAKKRMRLTLFFGASALNFSNTLSKVDMVASDSFRGIFQFSAETKKIKALYHITSSGFIGHGMEERLVNLLSSSSLALFLRQIH